jgi:hypothetical protein
MLNGFQVVTVPELCFALVNELTPGIQQRWFAFPHEN